MPIISFRWYNLTVIGVLFTIFVPLALLSVLVLIHEFGHFVAARKLGVVAEEFGLGLPPFARKLFTWKDTEFTLNWLPIGGFVRMRGEDPTSSSSAGLRGASPEKEGFFYAQAPWKRAIILLAGVTMNALLGIFLFTVAYFVLGIPQPGHIVTIDGVTVGSPAETAGIEAGDVVRELQVERLKGYQITSTEEFVKFINAHRGEEVTVVLKRGEEEKNIAVTPRTEAETPKDDGALGVAISNIEFVHYPWWQMPFRASVLGTEEAVGWGGTILDGLGRMAGEIFLHARFPKDLAGPVGIAKITGKVAKQGWIPLAQFAGILSVNLAIVNALPIPALDGGRLFFLLIEKLRGKPVNPKKERWAHLAGYGVLIAFIVLVTLHDIFRPAM